jgi:hypothetical protein
MLVMNFMCGKMRCHFIESRTKVVIKLKKEEQLWRWKSLGGECLLILMRLIINISNL